MPILKDLYKQLNIPEEVQRLAEAEIKGEEAEIDVPEGTEDEAAYRAQYEADQLQALQTSTTSYWNTKLSGDLDAIVAEQVAEKSKDFYPSMVNTIAEPIIKSGLLSLDRINELKKEKNHKSMITELIGAIDSKAEEKAGLGQSDKKDLLDEINLLKTENVTLQKIVSDKELEVIEIEKRKEEEKEQGMHQFKQTRLMDSEIDDIMPQLGLAAADIKELMPKAMQHFGYSSKVITDDSTGLPRLQLTDLKGANALSIDKSRELGPNVSAALLEIAEARKWMKVSETDDLDLDEKGNKKKTAQKSKAVAEFFKKK